MPAAYLSRFNVEAVEPISAVSDIYSDDDVSSAAGVVLDEFAAWEGCEMHQIVYAGDECVTDENLAWVNEIGDRDDYTQVIQFISSFHSPVEEEDLEGTVWEPDMEYTDYQWTLARVDGGQWELVAFGY